MTATNPSTSPTRRSAAAATAQAGQHKTVLDAVTSYHAEHGVAPSVEQLSVLLSLPSAQVRTSLRALAAAGRINRGKVGQS